MSGYNLKRNAFFCLKICFTFTNSVDHDEMQLYAAIYLGLNSLQKYPASVFLNTKVLMASDVYPICFKGNSPSNTLIKRQFNDEHFCFSESNIGYLGWNSQNAFRKRK